MYSTTTDFSMSSDFLSVKRQWRYRGTNVDMQTKDSGKTHTIEPGETWHPFIELLSLRPHAPPRPCHREPHAAWSKDKDKVQAEGDSMRKGQKGCAGAGAKHGGRGAVCLGIPKFRLDREADRGVVGTGITLGEGWRRVVCTEWLG